MTNVPKPNPILNRSIQSQRRGLPIIPPLRIRWGEGRGEVFYFAKTPDGNLKNHPASPGLLTNYSSQLRPVPDITMRGGTLPFS